MHSTEIVQDWIRIHRWKRKREERKFFASKSLKTLTLTMIIAFVNAINCIQVVRGNTSYTLNDLQARITTMGNVLRFNKQAAPGSSARQMFRVVDSYV